MIGEGLDQFNKSFGDSITDQSFVKLTLGKYRGTVPHLEKVSVRRVSIKGRERLSFTYRYKTKDTTKNYQVYEGVDLIKTLLGKEFLSANLFTLKHDMQLEISKRSKSRVTVSQPTLKAKPLSVHNQPKHRYISEDNVYLEALGITNSRGEIRDKMGNKWRQINKFIEIVNNLYEASALLPGEPISILDMGSGKGYLTFAIYDYFNNVLGVEASVTGVEARDDMVALCNDVAQSAGYSDLRFERGFIENFPVTATDILIALHACNTATDDAIYKGIQAGASIILCAPCCHKQIRPQVVPPFVLRRLLKFGVMLERQAEMITDAVRALLLEYSGYSTKVFEFVSTEHTQKNTMITGIKHARAVDKALIRDEIISIKKFFGIKEHYLERLLFAKEKEANSSLA